ncbi:MAG TPA: phytanoyl-CoA dioxygenase family protein [Gemmataceae bacterium]|jgi:ectoine hydroxylase-related dioxygenase (phytanoyl-CoA dioxygenase family)|nr:phytanoyl-CoA dioxygenase family protein [Gemmataceae bacterium]
MPLDRDGFALLSGVFSDVDCDRLLADWADACRIGDDGLMRSAAGTVYGARNILDRWAGAVEMIRQPLMMNSLRALLGDPFGLVRVLYFDKPPGESWALPWHKDLAIAVRDNSLASSHFERPTVKYGVPHVEAPVWLLEQMLTARVHLDEVTDENGPLRVLPGSHVGGKKAGSVANEVRITCGRGDMLLMRPLLSHCSGHAREGTSRHRRIMHFEFSSVVELPDGYRWQTYVQFDSESVR